MKKKKYKLKLDQQGPGYEGEKENILKCVIECCTSTHSYEWQVHTTMPRRKNVNTMGTTVMLRQLNMLHVFLLLAVERVLLFISNSQANIYFRRNPVYKTILDVLKENLGNLILLNSILSIYMFNKKFLLIFSMFH